MTGLILVNQRDNVSVFCSTTCGSCDINKPNIGGSNDEPLYDNSKVKTSTAWHAVMHFSLLPYTTITHLLELLQVLLPEDHQLPRSLYKLKRQYCSGAPSKQQFCSSCRDEVPIAVSKCPRIKCENSRGQLCWYVKVSFQDHLQEIYKG